MSQLSSQSVGRSVSQSESQRVSETINQPVSQSVSQSFTESKKDLTKYDKFRMSHSSTKHVFRLTRDYAVILKAHFRYLKRFICKLKSALATMVSTLQRPRYFRSWFSSCRNIERQLGALSDSDGWWNLGSETRKSCRKIMILRSKNTINT